MKNNKIRDDIIKEIYENTNAIKNRLSVDFTDAAYNLIKIYNKYGYKNLLEYYLNEKTKIVYVMDRSRKLENRAFIPKYKLEEIEI